MYISLLDSSSVLIIYQVYYESRSRYDEGVRWRWEKNFNYLTNYDYIILSIRNAWTQNECLSQNSSWVRVNINLYLNESWGIVDIFDRFLCEIKLDPHCFTSQHGWKELGGVRVAIWSLIFTCACLIAILISDFFSEIFLSQLIHK